jgi:small subunit ribosomal protein S6
MNLYEGMFIVPETVREEEFEAVNASLRAEIEKLGGQIESLTRIGQRGFARPLQKKKSGHYLVSRFKLDPAQLSVLRNRLKLGGQVFRAQFTRADIPQRSPSAGPVRDESNAFVQ